MHFAVAAGEEYEPRVSLAGLRKGDRMRLLEQVLVAERPHDGMFATVCTVGITPGRSDVIVLSAGHPAPLIITRDGAHPAPITYGPHCRGEPVQLSGHRRFYRSARPRFVKVVNESPLHTDKGDARSE